MNERMPSDKPSRLFEETVKRMLKTPPRPHKEEKKKSKKGGPERADKR
jgi:hypothetical protein